VSKSVSASIDAHSNLPDVFEHGKGRIGFFEFRDLRRGGASRKEVSYRAV